MLTVRNAEEDKVAALDAGADDYVAKPFSMPELLARIRTSLRRIPVTGDSSVTQAGDLEINPAARSVKVGGKEVRLTPKEFDLLHFLATNANATIAHTKRCRQSGDRTTATRSSTYELSSIRSGKN